MLWIEAYMGVCHWLALFVIYSLWKVLNTTSFQGGNFLTKFQFQCVSVKLHVICIYRLYA